MDNNQSLRLYPEKEVRALLKEVGTLTQKQIDWHINELTPIQIPGNDEIDNCAKEISNLKVNLRPNWISYKSILYGAEWVIEQIKQQADGKH